jgi:hypothetical protein
MPNENRPIVELAEASTAAPLFLLARVNPRSDRAQEADDYVDDLQPKLASGIIKCVRHA